jgi:hypothetical protein
MSHIDDELDNIIDAYLTYLDGAGPAPDLGALPDALREEARARLQLIDAMWGADSDEPPPANDPVVRRFGFDRAGQDIAVNGRRVASLRKAAGLDFKALLARIRAAGGAIAPAALLQLEQSPSTLVSQPTASALVAALDTTLSEIEAAVQPEGHAVRAFLDSPAFDELVGSWAAEHGHSMAQVRPVVVQRVLASNFRADEVTVEHVADIVRAVLASLEP